MGCYDEIKGIIVKNTGWGRKDLRTQFGSGARLAQPAAKPAPSPRPDLRTQFGSGARLAQAAKPAPPRPRARRGTPAGISRGCTARLLEDAAAPALFAGTRHLLAVGPRVRRAARGRGRGAPLARSLTRGCRSLAHSLTRGCRSLAPSLAGLGAGFFMCLAMAPFDYLRTQLMNQPTDRQVRAGQALACHPPHTRAGQALACPPEEGPSAHARRLSPTRDCIGAAQPAWRPSAACRTRSPPPRRLLWPLRPWPSAGYAVWIAHVACGLPLAKSLRRVGPRVDTHTPRARLVSLQRDECAARRVSMPCATGAHAPQSVTRAPRPQPLLLARLPRGLSTDLQGPAGRGGQALPAARPAQVLVWLLAAVGPRRAALHAAARHLRPAHHHGRLPVGLRRRQGGSTSLIGRRAPARCRPSSTSLARWRGALRSTTAVVTARENGSPMLYARPLCCKHALSVVCTPSLL